MIRSTLCGLAMLALAATAQAAKPPVFETEDGAIRGYDPVAYFTEGKPVMGEAGFTATHEGATYRFASAENRALFEADPEKYAPRYGGYCAFAVSKGATAPTDPQAWSIVDDQLYLNYSLDVRDKWRGDIPGNIEAADRNWPGVLE